MPFGLTTPSFSAVIVIKQKPLVLLRELNLIKTEREEGCELEDGLRGPREKPDQTQQWALERVG